MKEIKFEIENEGGELLRAMFICPEGNLDNCPVVIMITGDGPKGTKSLSWTNMPPRLLKHGIASLLFDFSGLGFSDGDRKFLTLTKGIKDFNKIINQLSRFEWIDTSRLGLMASSYGACVALLCPEILNKFKVVGLKSPCCFLPDAYLNEINRDGFNKWIKTGFCEENGYDISVLLDPFQYNAYEEAKKIKVPCLITHGDSDEIVPITQSLYLKELLSGNVQLKIFERCDHGYSGENWEKMAIVFENYYNQNLN